MNYNKFNIKIKQKTMLNKYLNKLVQVQKSERYR